MTIPCKWMGSVVKGISRSLLSIEHTKHARDNNKQCGFLDAVRKEEEGSMPEIFPDENKGRKATKAKGTKKPVKAARAPLKKLNTDLESIPEGGNRLWSLILFG